VLKIREISKKAYISRSKQLHHCTSSFIIGNRDDRHFGKINAIFWRIPPKTATFFDLLIKSRKSFGKDRK